MGLVNVLLPAHPHVLLLENGLEEGEGIDLAGKRMRNHLPNEYVWASPLGRSGGLCLNPYGGASWVSRHRGRRRPPLSLS